MEEYLGADFKLCLSKESFSIVGYCFVDDFTIIQVSPSPPTPTNETAKLAQDSLGLFAGSSRANGGKLCASKTKGYLLKLLWYKYGKWRLAYQYTNLTIDSQDGIIPNQHLPYSQSSSI